MFDRAEVNKERLKAMWRKNFYNLWTSMADKKKKHKQKEKEKRKKEFVAKSEGR